MVGSVCAAYFPVVEGASVGDPVNTWKVLRKDWYPAGRQNIFQRPPLPRTNKVPHRILDLQRRHSNNRCYLSNLHRRSPWDVGWHDPGAVSRHSSDSVCRRVNPGGGKRLHWQQTSCFTNPCSLDDGCGLGLLHRHYREHASGSLGSRHRRWVGARG